MRMPAGPLLTLRYASALVGALAALGCSEEATGPRPVPVGIVIASTPAQQGTVGQALDSLITAFVYDKFGDPVPGVLVRFTVPAGNGSVAPVARTTGPDGHASAAWRLPTRTGSYQAHAAAAGFDSITFMAAAHAGPPASLTAVTGDAQSGPAGSATDSAVVVLVRDAYGNPVRGATALFATREGSGQVEPARAETDSLGQARAVWTLGADGGVHALVVRVDSLPPLRLRATALPTVPQAGLFAVRMTWAELAGPAREGDGEVSGGRIAVPPAPRRSLACWRNALGEIALEPGAEGCEGVGE